MFIRASAFLLPVIALSSVVAAGPEPIAARTGSSCSNGTLQCCNSTLAATQTNANLLERLLGLPAGSIPVIGPLFAINCSPITIIAAHGGATCTQKTLCCQKAVFSGLVNVGCSNTYL